MRKIRAGLFVLLSSSFLQPSAFPQGSLTPPGPPGSTMLTLDQLGAKADQIDAKTEKRIPIDAIHTPGNPNTPNQFAITQPGSYYLPQNYNIAFPESNIVIGADNVTIDLNGFTLSCTGSNPDPAIKIFGNTNIVIKNGFIRGGVTVNGSTFSGSGYANGINCFGGTNIIVHNVAVSGIDGTGINLAAAKHSTVSSSRTAITKADGIRASNVMDSTAEKAGGDGINGETVSRCRGETVGANNKSGVYGIVVSDSLGVSTSNNYGLFATEAATNCTGHSSLGTGLSAGVASNCTGICDAVGAGLAVEVANNCRGTSAAANGIFAITATGCVGRTSGTSPSAHGIQVTNATNCRGSAVGSGVGLRAEGTANSCSGFNSGAGVGLSATIAIGCTGSSTTPANAVVATNKYLMP